METVSEVTVTEEDGNVCLTVGDDVIAMEAQHARRVAILLVEASAVADGRLDPSEYYRHTTARESLPSESGRQSD